MSLPLLYSEVKNWGKLVDTDLNTSFCANDFDLALKDSALLLDSERYRNNFLSLRWFQLDSPSIYTRELSHFLNYLTYFISLRLLRENEVSAIDLEKYFTDQVVAFLTRRSVDSVQLKEIYSYWNRAFKFLEQLVVFTKKYKHINTKSSVYFNTHSNLFKIDLPLIGWNNNKEIDCYLFVTFLSQKPNWFTIPTLYKIYSYFASHNVCSKNLKLSWFDLSASDVNPVVENIPLTTNVATMVSRYSNIEPFPFENIFDTSNPKYYNLTPLSSILK